VVGDLETIAADLEGLQLGHPVVLPPDAF